MNVGSDVCYSNTFIIDIIFKYKRGFGSDIIKKLGIGVYINTSP